MKPVLLAPSQADIFDSLFEKDETLPSLLPSKPSVDTSPSFSEPLYTKIKNISYTQYPANGSGENDIIGSTGYKALNNGLISLELPHSSEAKKADLISRMDDRTISEELFAHERSAWRSTIINKRIAATLLGYLLDKYVHSFVQTATAFIRQANDDKKINPEQIQVELDYVAKLLLAATQNIARTHAHQAGSFTIAPQELYSAVEQVARTIKSEDGISFEQRLVNTYLSDLPTLSGTLIRGTNHNEVLVDGKVAYAQKYAPPGLDEAPDGSWLSLEELKDLSTQALKNPASHLAYLKDKNILVHFLEFSKANTMEELFANTAELNWLRKELEKKPANFNALFLIAFEKEWISCLITKSQNAATLTVTDPHNKDRSTEKGMISLAQAIQDGLSQKPAPERKKEDVFKPFRDQKKGEAEVNYTAPLAMLKDEELPTLEDLFGEKIPNQVQVCIKQLKKEAPKGSVGDKLKNCFLLYGPPGTGKSTIAQVMARKAGRDIIYAGGGDFRDAYQGSGKAKLDAIFAEAKKRGNCIILIDEIDGTSNRLQPHNSTQEDNRAVKSLITTLDQYRHDPDIYVICTTNYPENIDPAIIRRFKRIEIPLPDYAQRKKIINYYLKQNNIAVASRTPHALSPDFYDKLISATDGFSGDTLGEMINSAVYEFNEGLEPEAKINLDFRTKGIDFSGKSLFANLGELALLTWTPLFMMIGESDLDKHVYSQHKRQLKVIADMKENERKNDPNDKHAKEPFFTRLFNRNWDRGGSMIERGFWDLCVRNGWDWLFDTAYKKIKHP